MTGGLKSAWAALQWVFEKADTNRPTYIELPIGFRVEQIDGQTILICDAECQASRMADLNRIAELEAENHDLTEELDNLRTALRDRWASVLPKDGGE